MNTFIVRDFDLKIFSYAWGGARDKGIAATAHNKLSSLLYPMISNRPGSNDDIMEILRNKLELISWRSSFRTCWVPGTDFKDVFTSKTADEITILGDWIFMFLSVKLDANVKCQNSTSREATGFILF